MQMEEDNTMKIKIKSMMGMEYVYLEQRNIVEKTTFAALDPIVYVFKTVVQSGMMPGMIMKHVQMWKIVARMLAMTQWNASV